MARSRFRENGGCVAPIAGRSWDVQRAAEKPLLLPWSENHNLTRGVLAITDHSDSEVKILGLFPVAKRKRHSMLRAPLAIQSWSSPQVRSLSIPSRRHGKFALSRSRVCSLGPWPIFFGCPELRGHAWAFLSRELESTRVGLAESCRRNCRVHVPKRTVLLVSVSALSALPLFAIFSCLG
jgi:hypothetical protein